MLGRLGDHIAVLAAATVMVVAVPTAAGAASHASPNVSVGPNQVFFGQVFGATQANIIEVVCGGVATTGHPAAGQSVDVQLGVSPVVSEDGFTGTLANRIHANLTWVQLGVGHVASIATFTSYAVKLPIPTKITVPCNGSGVMVFKPLPTSSSAKPSKVKVTFQSPGV
ncbi:MAG TPA: hypothetical protein VGS19_04840 [Streptosporangiaceae bacterium]|nr:hypothetical protein [Streptosporangiaceae bacterium]